MARHEATTRPEDEATQGNSPEKDVWYFTTDLLMKEATAILGADSAALNALNANLIELSANITKAKDDEACYQSCLEFLNKVEQEMGRSDGVYRVIYKTRWLIEHAKESTMGKSAEQVSPTVTPGKIPAPSELAAVLKDVADKDPEEQLSRVKAFFYSIPGFSDFISTLMQTQLSVAAGTAINEGGLKMLLPQEFRDQWNVVARMGFPIIIALMTWAIVQLTHKTNSKATLGKSSLNNLMSDLRSYARFAPETYEILMELAASIEKGIAKTGDFKEASTIIEKLRLSSTGRPVVGITSRLKEISTYITNIESACTPALTQSDSAYYRRLRFAATLLASTASKNTLEAVGFGEIVALITAGMQSRAESSDRPWLGKPNEIEIGKRIIDRTKEELGKIRKSADITDKFRGESTRENVSDDEIAISFYKDFKKIFNPWYAKVQTGDLLRQDHLRRAINEDPSIFDDLERLAELEREAAKKMEGYIGLSPKPEFLNGDSLMEAGANDKTRQISFRFKDDALKQLALLERVKQLIKTDSTFNEEKKGAADSFIKQWIEHMGLEKSQQKEVVEKDPKVEVVHATEAIVGELKENIDDPKKTSHVRYVRHRQQGSAHLETETANRESDWVGEARTTLLTPIQVGVYEKIAAIANHEGDPAKREAYERVLTDINKTREDEGLPPIA
jgi:hypothetical protein